MGGEREGLDGQQTYERAPMPRTLMKASTSAASVATSRTPATHIPRKTRINGSF